MEEFEARLAAAYQAWHESRGRTPDLGDICFALSDPTRREVVALLGEAPRRASELAQALRASRPAMSRHLRILRKAAIVREEDDVQDGRAHVVALERAGFSALRAYLDHVEDFWSVQLDAFKSVAEARAAELSVTPKRRKQVS